MTPGHSPGDVCRLCSTRSSSCRDEVPTRYRRTDDRPPPALRGPGARSRSGSPHRLQSAQTGPSGTPGASTNRGRSAERCWRSTGKPGPPAGSLLSGSAGSHRASASAPSASAPHTAGPISSPCGTPPRVASDPTAPSRRRLSHPGLQPSPSSRTAPGTPSPRPTGSVPDGSRKSRRGKLSPRWAPTPPPPPIAPPCRPRWVFRGFWFSGSALLGDFHRPDRSGEIAARRHAIPQPVEVVFQPLLELLDRHPVGPGRSTVPLHLQPRIPHQVLGDVLRLALQLRLTHAIPSLSVDHIRAPGRPRPFAPQPTAIRRRITATPRESASAPRVGTQPLTDSAAWGSPSRVPAPLVTLGYGHPGIGTRLHMFQTRAWTRLMLPVCRTPPGQ